MLRAANVLPPGSFDPALCETVTLGHGERHRRRIALRGDAGTAFLLDLAEARALRHGEGLRLDDGRIVVVRAAPEPLMEVTASNAHHLARLAWHIGNRHLTAMICEGRILVRPDHVVAGMIAGLGGSVREVTEPFDPEGGAYPAGGAHDHGKGHRHGR